MAAEERYQKLQNLPDDGELNEAICLVEICANLTKGVQNTQAMKKKSKKDNSPVTIADLAVQALVTLYLQETRQGFHLIAEEDSTQCKDGEILTSVTNLINTHFPFESCGERTEFTTQEVINALENSDADPSLVPECWVMDPIDGTRGFVNSEQYAVALGKIKDGKLEFACVACPNVPEERPFINTCTYNAESHFYSAPGNDPEQQTSWLMAAIRGHGCRQTYFDLGQTGTLFEGMEQCQVSTKEGLFDFNFCESSNHPPGTQAKTARMVKATEDPEPTYRMDSMVKYCLVAAGEMDGYLRFSGCGRQKVWDHVGELLVTEAGGSVTDVEGRGLNFGLGKFLTENTQIVASNGNSHQLILDVAEAVIKGS